MRRKKLNRDREEERWRYFILAQNDRTEFNLVCLASSSRRFRTDRPTRLDATIRPICLHFSSVQRCHIDKKAIPKCAMCATFNGQRRARGRERTRTTNGCVFNKSICITYTPTSPSRRQGKHKQEWRSRPASSLNISPLSSCSVMNARHIVVTLSSNISDRSARS